MEDEHADALKKSSQYKKMIAEAKGQLGSNDPESFGQIQTLEREAILNDQDLEDLQAVKFNAGAVLADVKRDTPEQVEEILSEIDENSDTAEHKKDEQIGKRRQVSECAHTDLRKSDLGKAVKTEAKNKFSNLGNASSTSMVDEE